MPPKRRKVKLPKSKQKNSYTVKSSGQKVRKRRKDVKCYVCKTCNETFDSNSSLLGHGCDIKLKLSDLVTKPTFICKECPKKFHFKKSFTEHLRTEHSTLPNSEKCKECPARCPDKHTLEEHMKKTHQRDIYLCPNCNKEFVRHSHVLRHLSQSACNSNPNATLYVCEVCNTQFRRKDNLMVHMRLQHIIKGEFECKYCEYSTRNYSKLIQHWHKNHSDTPGQFKCDQCGNWTSSKAAMNKHLEIHGEKKYECQICGYSTFTIEVIRRHALTHVTDKPYKCAHCDKSYIQRKQLQSHEKNKHNTIMCSKCGDTFHTKTRLMQHMVEHQGAGQQLYCPIKKCPNASVPFKTDASLQKHLQVHIEEREYICEVCRKKFSSEVTLKIHLDTHTLDKPRRCMYCVNARAYIRGEQLVKHVRKCHTNMFRTHLLHIRNVLGRSDLNMRVTKSEIESIVNVMDAEAEQILQQYSGSGLLYGGVDDAPVVPDQGTAKTEDSPLMSEAELAENLGTLLSQLVDHDTLEMFGWPEQSVDEVLGKLIEQCGARPASRVKWTRVQRLRENAKHLFVYVIEDQTIANMLDTHTIDQVVKHVVQQVSAAGETTST